MILFLGSYSLILLGFGYAVVNSFFSDINTIDATVQNNIFQDITALNNNHGFINYKNINLLFYNIKILTLILRFYIIKLLLFILKFYFMILDTLIFIIRFFIFYF